MTEIKLDLEGQLKEIIGMRNKYQKPYIVIDEKTKERVSEWGQLPD